MVWGIVFVAAVAAVSLNSGQAAAGGHLAAGEKAFKKCQACHTVDPAKKGIGPNLRGVVGRKAGTLPGYAYSAAMQRSGLVWNGETLDKYLKKPTQVLTGTKMVFPGIANAEERASLIAYLESLSEASAQKHDSGAGPARTARANPVALSTPRSEAPAQKQDLGGGPVQTAQAQPRNGTLPADVALPAGYIPDVRYQLRTGIAEGRMVFIGIGGNIDGQANPKLAAAVGEIVQITLINGEGAAHDISFEELGIRSQQVVGKGASTTVAFRVRATGTITYFCSVAGHRQAGMEGMFEITQTPAAGPLRKTDIVRDPAQIPPPIERRAPARVQVNLESVELDAQLADSTTYHYWTFNGTVPGPFLRVRVGDTVEVNFANHPDSAMIHSVDFHAATGPGGGAAHLQVEPGKSGQIEFKALAPGLYVYHCATPMVAHHIANGMYGLILVEPEGGLPKVDREFYVMQGEVYTQAPFGEQGAQEFSVEKLLDERPEYFVFNGAVGALTAAHPLRAKVGETVRIYFGVGGPNFTSSFHVIGEIFDRAFAWGDVVSPPNKSVQTVSVAPGGAFIADFKLEVPGRYILVDHALSRLERGLAGFLLVEGAENPDVYRALSAPASAGGH